jgi:hypothetical protein
MGRPPALPANGGQTVQARCAPPGVASVSPSSEYAETRVALQRRRARRVIRFHEPASIINGHWFRGGSCPLIPLGPGRSDRPRRSGRSWRTRRSRRTGEAAVLYQHISRIRPGSDLYGASGGKFWSNPPKSSGRSALDLHCFARADLDLHAGLARSPDPSYDDYSPRDIVAVVINISAYASPSHGATQAVVTARAAPMNLASMAGSPFAPCHNPKFDH